MKAMDRVRLCVSVVLLVFGVSGGQAHAQRAVNLGTANTTTYPAVLLSDLHFDPLHDPAKVPLLAKAPVAEWDAILSSPESADQADAFDAVQKVCKSKAATDAPYALFTSALRAARAQSPDAKFVLVSGDLLVHELDCRYRAAMHLEKNKNDDESVSAPFAEKTVVYVMKSVEKTFSGVPVYFALGNNDSRCNHNRMDVGDEFFKASSGAMLDGLVGISASEREDAKDTYEKAGYYAVTMAAPMERTRLLVVDDTFMMAKFANCEADAKDDKGAEEQLKWLKKQLSAARIRGERVWVLGHLPPAVNPKSSLEKGKEFCSAGEADTFITSDRFADLLTEHADVVKLGIFGHTHMDEFHVIGAKGAEVPIKVVPSVTNVDGNTPSFTVAQVSPSFAMLTDYSVYEASNVTGVGTAWALEYGFDNTYGQTMFSAKSLDELVAEFRADPTGKTPESKAYEKFYDKGAPISPLETVWPGYVCSLDHGTKAGFKACVCGK